MINVDDRLLNELDESEMYLVLHIAKHMKSTRMTAWPSLDTLSKACNWDERTVKKHRQSLIDKGYLRMKMQPGKPTLYWFLKDGISVYTPIKTEDGIAENEGANIEGGTKNEGTQNENEGVQKMRGVRVQKMYPEVIKGINKESIKEEEKDASLSSSSKPENNPVKAEKKENDLHRGAGGDYDFCACEHCGGAGFRYGRNGKEVCPECDGSRTVVKPKQPLEPPFAPVGTIEPAPAILARLYSPEHPDISIVTSVPGTYTPNTEFRRVNIPEEIERLKTDAAAKETFALVRKIPSNLYPDYVEAFEKEIGGTGETYHNLPAFRKHFFNWCGSRYEIAQRKTNTPKTNRSQINHAGGNPDKYLEKQIF